MKWIRPACVVLLILTVSVGFVIGKIDSDFYGAFATGLIIYWFKDRTDSKHHP